MFENFIDAFKEYVPAEILAAFIAINSLLKHQAPLDIYLIILAIGVCMIYFVAFSIKYRRIRSKVALAAVALSIPFWCMMIAIDRFDEHIPTEDIKMVITVVLILLSLGLSLFVRGTKNEEKPA